MRESYSEHEQAGDGAAGGGTVSEPAASSPLARELLAQLLPAVDVDLLLAGLLAERAAPARDPASPAPAESELDAPARELRRIRAQLALGESARMAQHAVNNPLTALLAEAQLLELEPLAPEHRQAASRLVELARRVAAAIRRLDAPGGGDGKAGG